MSGSTKALHSLPHFVPNTLLLQEIDYQTYLHGVVSSLHKSKKGLWPSFPLSIGVYQIENFKQAKEEVSILSPFRLSEVTFQRHDPQGKLKEYLQQIGFTWSYAHEDLLLRELSQQHVLLKSKIPTPEQMIQVDKESERQKSKVEKKKASIEQNILPMDKDCERELSSSSISMYNLNYSEEGSYFFINPHCYYF